MVSVGASSIAPHCREVVTGGEVIPLPAFGDRGVGCLSAPPDVDRCILDFRERAAEFVVDNPRQGFVLLVGPLPSIGLCHRDEGRSVQRALKDVMENQTVFEPGSVRIGRMEPSTWSIRLTHG